MRHYILIAVVLMTGCGGGDPDPDDRLPDEITCEEQMSVDPQSVPAGRGGPEAARRESCMRDGKKTYFVRAEDARRIGVIAGQGADLADGHYLQCDRCWDKDGEAVHMCLPASTCVSDCSICRWTCTIKSGMGAGAWCVLS